MRGATLPYVVLYGGVPGGARARFDQIGEVEAHGRIEAGAAKRFGNEISVPPKPIGQGQAGVNAPCILGENAEIAKQKGCRKSGIHLSELQVSCFCRWYVREVCSLNVRGSIKLRRQAAKIDTKLYGMGASLQGDTVHEIELPLAIVCRCACGIEVVGSPERKT